MKTLDFLAGTRIEHACSEAVAEAQATGDMVQFEFNGVTLTAEPKSNPKTLETEFFESLKAQAHRDSTEGFEEVVRAARERVEKRERMAQLLHELAAFSSVADSQDSLMRWLNEFTDVADYVGVALDFLAVCDKLHSLGFETNAHVGKPQEFFADKRNLAEYIIGQALDCMHKGMPPHPVTQMFIARYFSE